MSTEEDCKPDPTNLFHKELEQLINKYSKENNSGTPDFILASFLDGCLKVYEETVQSREKWHGRPTNTCAM